MTENTMSLPMQLDARLIRLAADLTAGNPVPPPRVVERFGSPEEQVLKILRNTARAAEGMPEDEAMACCEAAGRVRAAQLASIYGLGAGHF